MLLQTIFLLATAMTPASATVYSNILSADASDLFSHFTTFTGTDPTNGWVNYTDMGYANQEGLLATKHNDALNKDTAYIGVDHTNVAPSGRNSVRLSSRENFTVGSLFVFDIAHVPNVYGQWSAVWLLGQDGVWPSSGEIDIFETVHTMTNSEVTLHTDPGCTVDPQDQVGAFGTLQNEDCSADNGHTGCMTKLPDTLDFNGGSTHTAGQPYNDQNGGVIVLEWIQSGIYVWMFDRDNLPTTLTWDNPDSYGFPEPAARYSGSGCLYDQSFRDMQLIINIDVCGDWAGKVWNDVGAADATGVSTCNDFATNNPSAYNEAFFEIVSLKVYSAQN